MTYKYAGLENYYLDLNKIQTLDKEEKDRIHEMYRDMLYSFQDSRPLVGNSYLNTLYRSGYLVDIRNEKIEEILSESNSVNS
jgi:hypothetical protein